MTNAPQGGSDVDRFLPLTDLAFSILLALDDGACHGYALLQELRRRTARAALRTGTVYAALARLQDQSLVREAEDHPTSGPADKRRRYYAVTELGRRVARAEASRLDELLSIARRKDLLGPGVGS